MDLSSVASELRQALGARQVFGEPVERDGVTVIPAAIVVGGGGGGSAPGTSADGGLGFGLFARPAGAFEIRDGAATWHPAIDRTLLGVAAMIAGVVALRLVLRAGRRR